MNEQLPKGWERATVAELLNGALFTDGDWVESKDQDPDGVVRLLQLADVGEGAFRDRSDRWLNQPTADRLSCTFVQERDVMVARMPAPLGRACLAPRLDYPAVTVVDVCVMRPNSREIDPTWLMWAINAPQFRGRVLELESGTTRKRISRKNLATIDLPVPPRAEQERIVAALEEHLSRLDAAEAALESANRKLDALMTSSLVALTSGSWPLLPLSEVAQSVKNGVFVSRPGAQPPGHPIYRISAVRALELNVGDVRYADPVPETAEKYRVEAGDLLFTRYSGNPDYVGAAAVVPPAGAGVLHPDKLIRVTADAAVILPEWLAAYVAAGSGRREIEKRLKTTAGQVGISGTQLKSVPIAAPPLDYQHQAVARLRTVLDERARISRQLAAASGRATALRRSVLAAAFSGQLVPHDPSDEPALALLERIAVEQPVKKSRKKKS